MDYAVFSNGKEIRNKEFIETLPSDETMGVFESMRTYRGQIFRLEEHLKRFMESAHTIGLTLNKDKVRKELKDAFHTFVTTHGPDPDNDLFLRVTWWEGKIVIIIGERKHPASLYKEGIVLKTSPVKRTLTNASPAEVKTAAYHNAFLASVEPQTAYEWVFLDRNGFVTEVRIGNLFIIKNKRLITPPTTGILNGVTRRFVIECAHQLQIPVQEAPITRHEVYNADEAFLTNTSWEVLPVRELDSRRIGREIPGPLTLKLHQTFKQKALKECR